MAEPKTITSLPFRSVLWELAKELELNPDPNLGEVTFGTPDLLISVHRLNMAAEWAWREEMVDMTLPETLTGVEVTVTDGVVSADDVANSDWVSLWTTDPRIDERAERVRYADGFRLLGSVLTSCFALYRMACPVFTSREVVGATAYAVDERVLNPVDGHCYVCLVEDALGSELADAEKWAQVTLPLSLKRSVLCYARYLHFRAKALPQNSNPELKHAQEAIDGEVAKHTDSHTGRQPRWLVNPTLHTR